MKKLIVVAASVWAVAASGQVTLDGQFTSAGEWPLTPVQHGIYSDFRWQRDSTNLYIMNDWWNTAQGFQLQTNTQWNTFLFTDNSANNWEFRVYATGTVEVWKNGNSDTTSGIQGAYGFGHSPALSSNHTLYEVCIPNTIIFDVIREKDPRFPDDIGDGGWLDTGPDGNGFIVPEPSSGMLLLFLGGGLALLRKSRKA